MRSRGGEQGRQVDQARQVMRVRIAYVNGERVPSMLLQERCQPTLDLSESIIPAHAHPLITPAHHRFMNAVRISMRFLETIGFRANVARTEYILSIPPYGKNVPARRLDLSSAGGFTQWTSCIADLC